MPNASGNKPDLSFYTELRYPDTAENIIHRYTAAMRGLVVRQVSDLRTGGRGEFGGHSDPMLGPLADGMERMQGHVDAVEAVALRTSNNPDQDRQVRNVVANVIADSNIAALAETHAEMAKAREGKFDQQQGATINGTNMDIADKLWQISDLMGGVVGLIINLISLTVRDIGILGPPTAGVSMVELEHQLENKLNFVMPQVDRLKDGQSVIDSIVRRGRTDPDHDPARGLQNRAEGRQSGICWAAR